MANLDVFNVEQLVNEFFVKKRAARNYVSDLMFATHVFHPVPNLSGLFNPDEKIKALEATSDYVNKVINAEAKKTVGFNPKEIDNILHIYNGIGNPAPKRSLYGFGEELAGIQTEVAFDYENFFNVVSRTKPSKQGLSERIGDVINFKNNYFTSLEGDETKFSLKKLSNKKFLSGLNIGFSIKNIKSKPSTGIEPVACLDYQLEIDSDLHRKLTSDSPSDSKKHLLLNPYALADKIKVNAFEDDPAPRLKLVENYMQFHDINSVDDALLYRQMELEQTKTSADSDIIIDSMLDFKGVENK